jgi:hypothetical protein
MIRNLTLLIFLLIFSISFSQIRPVGHLTIFSEDGDKFTLILNGETINDTPQTNLRVEDLNQPYYNAKIKFSDQNLADISKNNLMLTDIDGIFSDVTYKIKRDKNNKSKMKMNYFSAIPIQPDFIPASNVFVVQYGQPRPVQTQQLIVQPAVGFSQTTTTTTTQTGGLNVGVGVNIGGINMGISINDSMGGAVTTQTTTSTTTDQNNVVVDNNGQDIGCGRSSCMTLGNFNIALSTIKKQNFEDTKLKTAKQIITANCLNVDQIIQIANEFNFEDNKLDFAKFAYDYCIETRNYFKLNSIFSFSSNVDELSDYVQSRQ